MSRVYWVVQHKTSGAWWAGRWMSDRKEHRHQFATRKGAMSWRRRTMAQSCYRIVRVRVTKKVSPEVKAYRTLSSQVRTIIERTLRTYGGEAFKVASRALESIGGDT